MGDRLGRLPVPSGWRVPYSATGRRLLGLGSLFVDGEGGNLHQFVQKSQVAIAGDAGEIERGGGTPASHRATGAGGGRRASICDVAAGEADLDVPQSSELPQRDSRSELCGQGGFEFSFNERPSRGRRMPPGTMARGGFPRSPGRGRSARSGFRRASSYMKGISNRASGCRETARDVSVRGRKVRLQVARARTTFAVEPAGSAAWRWRAPSGWSKPFWARNASMMCAASAGDREVGFATPFWSGRAKRST